MLSNYYIYSIAIISCVVKIIGSTTTTPTYNTNTIENANILCDSVDQDVASFTECNKYSDVNYACCFLSTTATGDLFNQTVYNTSSFYFEDSFQQNLCVPFQTRSTPYPTITQIAGIGYQVTCPVPLPSNATSIVNKNFTFPRGTSCGPRRAYSFSDCNDYTLSDNTCCIAQLRVDKDFEVNACFFYGTKFSTALWKSINAQKDITDLNRENNITTPVFVDVNGVVNNTLLQTLDNNTISFFNGYVYNQSAIGFTQIYCRSAAFQISFAIFMLFFFIYY